MEEKKLDIIISDLLKQLGVSANIKGYYYLRFGIKKLIRDMSFVGNIVKRLYPIIAEEFETTPSRAERGIRHAIETSWNRGDEDTVMKVFGHSTSALKGKPTNSEYLATIADYILITESKGDA